MALLRALAALVCIVAAIASAVLAWFARDQASIAFMMCGAAFFFACVAYAAMFRPESLSVARSRPRRRAACPKVVC